MPRLVDQLKCNTRGKEKTSQTSNYVLVSMRKVAAHDWGSCEPRMRTLQKGQGMGLASTDVLPIETVAYIQSAGCKLQKKSVIGAHNRCWKYLIGAISNHGEAKRNLEFIGGDKDRQLKQLWEEAKIGDILPCDEIEDEAEWLLASV